MKFVMFGEKGQEVAGVLDQHGAVRDISHIFQRINGDFLTSEAYGYVQKTSLESFPRAPEGCRLGPCITDVGKIICVGLNYHDHAAETGRDLPEEPILFMKATSAIAGPIDNIELPKGSAATDWEVELGVIIGKTAKYVSEDTALDHVAGYCIINDVSERHFQSKRAGQWTKGKSADTFAPLGPWLVTADDVPDPQDLSLFCEVNGVRYQDSTTHNMHVGVSGLIAYISHFMTLHPGDIIATGTPAGVGMGQDPKLFLKPGDTLRLGIDGLGEQHCTVIGQDES